MARNNMRIAIIGGHLSPALSVIDALPKDKDVIFIGRKQVLEGDKAVSLEEKVITEKGIPFYPITTGRLQRRITRHTLFSLLKLPVGVQQALSLLKKTCPDVVLSFGSYVSLPVVFASFLRSIPIVIHEQTLEAGLANRIAARFATKICISWESSRRFFPKEKTVLTGNPIRKFSLGAGSSFAGQISNEKLPLLYITGGSLGSHAINLLIDGCIEQLLDKHLVYHQTGDAREFNDFERLENRKKQLSELKQSRYTLTKFVSSDDIGVLLKQADLVVGRSGINTVSELLYFEKSALLIPLPFSQRKEQKKNALFLERIGLAKVVEQNGLTSEILYSQIEERLRHKLMPTKEVGVLSNLLQKAAENVVEVIEDVAKFPSH